MHIQTLIHGFKARQSAFFCHIGVNESNDYSNVHLLQQNEELLY